MAARQARRWKARWFATIGVSGIIAGSVMIAFLMSPTALGNTTPSLSIRGANQGSAQHSQLQPPGRSSQGNPIPLQDNDLATNAMLLAQTVQQPANVNGRLVYAVPAIVGPDATTILQTVVPNAVVYVVHPLAGWGKSVSTTVSWFRCADIISANQYNGSQVEVENWTLLTQQERMEAEAACSLSTFSA